MSTELDVINYIEVTQPQLLQKQAMENERNKFLTRLDEKLSLLQKQGCLTVKEKDRIKKEASQDMSTVINNLSGIGYNRNVGSVTNFNGSTSGSSGYKNTDPLASFALS